MKTKYICFVILAILAFGAGIALLASMPARTASAAKAVSADAGGAAPVVTCTPGWSLVPSPNVGANNNYLQSVAAISSDDVWAVGYYTGTGRYQTLIEHWNGALWSIVPSPNPGANNNLLYGVSAASASDVWAVGWYDNDNYYNACHLITMRWNGTQWTEIANPDPGGNYTNWLNAVGVVASNDVWAVGFYRQYSPQALIMHWNGSAWSVVPNPGPYAINFLTALGVISASDMWAVGYTNGPPYNSVAWHWNGSAWSVAPIPTLGALYGVGGVAGNDVWAAGENGVAHWDGSAWTTVSAPNIGVARSVAAISSGDVWVVGDNGIIHWNGATWSAAPTPVSAVFYGVSAVSSNELWAVGNYPVGGVAQTLTDRYVGVCPSPTPSPTPCPVNYTYRTSSGSVTQGTTLLPGSQCGRCTVPVALPFPFTFYGQTYTSANVLTVGNVQFATTDTSTASCLPDTALGPAILPNWDTSLETSFTSPCQQYLGRPCGVYTSVSGSAPNRIFNIEWLTRRIGSNRYTAQFELQLYEGTGVFDFVYAVIIPIPPGHWSSVGVQDGARLVTNYACFVDNSINQGLLITWNPPSPCGPAYTPTPTNTITNTPTITMTPTVTTTPAVQLCNPTPINILDRGPNPTDTPGPGFPYPSNINASGLTGVISNVRVVLNNMSHTFPDDLDILLVGPGGGRRVLLMSDAGGDPDLNNVTLTFDDAGPALPDSTQITSGIYRPTDYAGNDGVVDYFNPPAPAGPYSATLSIFNGTSPNGTWSLYVQDDQNGNTGSISNGWCLQFTLVTPTSTPTLTRTPTPTATCPPLRMVVGQSQAARPSLIHSAANATNRFAARRGTGKTGMAGTSAGFSPDTPVNFLVDDGTRETSIGFGGTDESAALWLNRFTPPVGSFPITLNGIQILWPDQSGTGDNLPGKTARLVVYQDTDGDGNPSNATLLGQVNVTIGVTETYENYPVNITAPGPTGDLYIGFEDLWAEAGYTPRMYPASQDTTSSQARSWIAAMGSGAAPDINNLGNNDQLGTIDSFGLPGNWMVRATGNTQQGGCSTSTPTRTPTSQAVLVGHVTWQGPPAQPDTRQQLPVTLTLKLGATEVNYPSQSTDASGLFTVSVAGMPGGSYQWRVKGPKYLANAGIVSLAGSPTTSAEMGLLRAGDCNNDNTVSGADFNILKLTFGKSLGDPGYDARADFTNDNVVNLPDFNLVKNNFGQGGAPPVGPGH